LTNKNNYNNKNNGCMGALHITYGKRFAPSGLGLRKNAVGLRPLCIFAPPHFCGCWNCFAIPSSQPQKRRLPVHVKRQAQDRYAR